MRAMIAFCLTLLASAGAAQDRADYYYPPITSIEIFDRTIAVTPSANRAVRIGFVTQVTSQQLQAPFPPRYAVFAKGAEADEMIITALDDQIFASLFRARALMAQLSAPARRTEFFVKEELSDVATYYDMLKIMGFKTLILTDGVRWSHQVDFR